MSTLTGWWHYSVDADEVFPVHMLDDTTTLRGIVVIGALVFNEEKFHASRARLLDIGDCKKVSGKLRLEVSCPRDI